MFTKHALLFMTFIYCLFWVSPGKQVQAQLTAEMLTDSTSEMPWGENKLKELNDRALSVQEKYPWLVVSDYGLSVNAARLSPNEFLQGLHAATDLIFAGTDELPNDITFFGFYRNIDELLQQYCLNTPSLEQRVKGNQIQFINIEKSLAGLSELQMRERYLRPKPLIAAKPGMGTYYSGTLIVQGYHMEQPLALEVNRNENDSVFYFMANNHIIRKIAFLNPIRIDQQLFSAQSPTQFITGLRSKLDMLWAETADYPFSSTPERLIQISQQVRFLPMISTIENRTGTLYIRLRGGESVDWHSPQADRMNQTEMQASRLAYELLNTVIGGLISGGIVFVSDKQDPQVLYDGPQFSDELSRIAAERALSLSQKEIQIRNRWPEYSEPVLEYFYNSVYTTEAESTVLPTVPNQSNANQPYTIQSNPTPSYPVVPTEQPILFQEQAGAVENATSSSSSQGFWK